jgi:hypothetical protein
MKPLIKTLFLALMTMFIMQPTHAQRFLKKLQEKIEQKVEEKVDERVEEKKEEAIDKQLEKVEESMETDETSGSTGENDSANKRGQREQRMQNILKGSGMSGEPVPLEDSYSYNYLIQMHIESFDKSGEKEEEGEFITHFNPDTKSMAYEMISGDMSGAEEGTIIIDIENGAIIILGEDESKKTGIAYGMSSFFNSIGESYEETDIESTPQTYLANPNVTKTGRTKSIAGYKCEEYRYNDEDTESFVWITKDLRLGARDYFSSLYKTSLYSQGIPWGCMMEVTSTDKQTGEKSFMQVTRVDKNSRKHFSLSDYQINNLGSFKMQEEK